MFMALLAVFGIFYLPFAIYKGVRNAGARYERAKQESERKMEAQTAEIMERMRMQEKNARPPGEGRESGE